MQFNTYETVVLGVEHISKNVLVVKALKPEGFNFLPGQFVSISVLKNVKRSYSISSSPTNSYIEFIVDTSPGGPGSIFFKNLNIGEPFTFLGPFGHMFFDSANLNVSSVNFISTGTGYAPFVSIYSFLNENKFSGKVVSLYSEKYAKDFIKVSLIPKNFVEFRTTTRQKPVKGLLSGRVTNFFENLNYSGDSLFYICGNKSMIFSTIKFLKEVKKIPDIRIKKEIYY